MRKSTHYPNLVNAYDFYTEGSPIRSVSAGVFVDGEERYVPARAIGFCSLGSAIRLAWGVFRGRYDALVWPGQGDDR